MRVSTQNLYNRSIESINDVNSQLQNTQLQMSSGKKILNPSDDPVASTRILQMNQELSLNEQYQKNVQVVQGNLELQDDLLGSIDEVIQRIRELTISAGNGSYNADDLNYIAVEIETRLEQLAGMMNSQDASGEFVFGGFQGEKEPFQQNVSGSYGYEGDEGRRYIQIDASVKIPATENGKQIFVDIEAAKNTFFTEVNPNNQSEPAAVITTGQVINQADYDAFYPEDIVVEFNPVTNVTPNGSNYTLKEASSGRVLLSDQPYISGAPISTNGIQFEVVGNPLPGDSFFVQSAEKQGLLTSVEKWVYGLENFSPTPEGRAAFDALLESTITNLDNAETSVLEARSQIGARLNTIETTKEQLLDVELLTTEALSNIQDLDYAEAISNLSLQQFILESAYSTFSKVTSLGLFDRL